MIATALAPTSSPAATADRTEIVVPRDRLEATLVDALGRYAGRSDSSGKQRWRAGVFLGLPATCPVCQSGAALGAAVLLHEHAPLTGAMRMTTGTIDHLITTGARADGAFAFAGDRTSADILTAFLADDIGTALAVAHRELPARTRARWTAVVTRAADFLIANGNLRWYTNGNIVLANASVMWLAWRAGGDRRFRERYDAALRFALDPPRARWPGRGLRLVRAPLRADGADGAGYLTESAPGGGTPGFDPEYTAVQADLAAKLYLLSRDPRALRLTNLLTNMLLPRISGRWWLDTSRGSRHSEAEREVPFFSPAVSVLTSIAGRTDLAGDVAPQVDAIDAAIRSGFTYVNPDYYKSLGGRLGIALVALSTPRAGDPRDAGHRSRPGTRPRPTSSSGAADELMRLS